MVESSSQSQNRVLHSVRKKTVFFIIIFLCKTAIQQRVHKIRSKKMLIKSAPKILSTLIT